MTSKPVATWYDTSKEGNVTVVLTISARASSLIRQQSSLFHLYFFSERKITGEVTRHSLEADKDGSKENKKRREIRDHFIRLILTSVLLKIGRKGHQDRSRSSCEIPRRQGAIAVERGQLGIGRQLTDPSTTPRRDKSEIPPYSTSFQFRI